MINDLVFIAIYYYIAKGAFFSNFKKIDKIISLWYNITNNEKGDRCNEV